MISFAALHKLSRAWADLRQAGITKDEPPVLVLCQRCTEVLRRALSERFPLVDDPCRRSVSRSQVMGFTLSHGPPEQCALHPFLQEAAACPSK